MSLIKNKNPFYFLLFLSCFLNAQEKERDSTKTEKLKEVVVVGAVVLCGCLPWWYHHPTSFGGTPPQWLDLSKTVKLQRIEEGVDYH